MRGGMFVPPSTEVPEAWDFEISASKSLRDDLGIPSDALILSFRGVCAGKFCDLPMVRACLSVHVRVSVPGRGRTIPVLTGPKFLVSRLCAPGKFTLHVTVKPTSTFPGVPCSALVSSKLRLLEPLPRS